MVVVDQELLLGERPTTRADREEFKYLRLDVLAAAEAADDAAVYGDEDEAHAALTLQCAAGGQRSDAPPPVDTNVTLSSMATEAAIQYGRLFYIIR